ncbi:MAG: hypothetical protein JSR44_12935 [Spirochaetes bacterium]|nr:hypothetical protein [Spirochaetota bacterium]
MQWWRRARSSGFLSATLFAIFAVLLATQLLRTISRLRLFELSSTLQSYSEKNDEVRNTTLLSRLALITQSAMTGGRENAATYKKEAESALIAIRQNRQTTSQASIADRAILPLVNGFNWVLGLPRLSAGRVPERDLVLDFAFEHETYREYARAAQTYEIYIADFNPQGADRDFALLHRGFCNAMTNAFDAAIADFSVVADNTLSKSAPIATKLRTFIQELKERIRFIESLDDPARKGELYYEASAYLKALDNFARVEKSQQTEKVRFLTARALEETGRSQEAIQIYRTLVAHGGTFALNANRRMYLLGTFLGQDKALANESKKNSETIVPDKEFIGAVTHLEKTATELHEEAAAARAQQKKEISAVEKRVEAKAAAPATKAPAPAVVNPPANKIPTPPIKPKKAEPNLRIEKNAQVAETLPEAKKEQLIKKQNEKVDKLTMLDGNIFYGVVYKETDSTIFLYSVLGNLEFDKTTVARREKVDAANALK